MPSEEKTALRRHLRLCREAIPPEERQRRDAFILDAIRKSRPFREADTLLGYAPIGAEIDILPLLREAEHDGKRVALPRTHGAGIMTFHYVSSWEALTVSSYGIREPSAEAPLYTGGAALCLVPALAFDGEGYRIGYGGGYYDRFLAAHEVTAIGVIYRELLRPHLPHEAHDRPVAAIATEDGIFTIPQEPR